MKRHPMQEIYDDDGTPRFRENVIVQALLQHGQNTGFGLYEIAKDVDFSQDDYEQFSQLHGYSLRGYHELSGVSDESAFRASEAAKAAGLPDTGCRSTDCNIHLGVETV